MLSDSEIRQRLVPTIDPEPDQIPRRPATGLIAVLVVLVLCVFGGSVTLFMHYYRAAPHQPDPPSGHVYRFTDTRHTVYLTKHQRTLAWGAIAVPVASAISVAAFSLYRRKPVPIEPF
jgi:hypothetical protein